MLQRLLPRIEETTIGDESSPEDGSSHPLAPRRDTDTQPQTVPLPSTPAETEQRPRGSLTPDQGDGVSTAPPPAGFLARGLPPTLLEGTPAPDPDVVTPALPSTAGSAPVLGPSLAAARRTSKMGDYLRLWVP